MGDLPGGMFSHDIQCLIPDGRPTLHRSKPISLRPTPIADGPQRFAAELIALLTGNDTLRQQCALQARRYVEAHHQWPEHGVQLERLLQEVVRRPATES